MTTSIGAGGDPFDFKVDCLDFKVVLTIQSNDKSYSKTIKMSPMLTNMLADQLKKYADKAQKRV